MSLRDDDYVDGVYRHEIQLTSLGEVTRWKDGELDGPMADEISAVLLAEEIPLPECMPSTVECAQSVCLAARYLDPDVEIENEPEIEDEVTDAGGPDDNPIELSDGTSIDLASIAQAKTGMYRARGGNWDEQKHPRSSGKFAPKGGGDSGSPASAPAPAPAGNPTDDPHFEAKKGILARFKSWYRAKFGTDPEVQKIADEFWKQRSPVDWLTAPPAKILLTWEEDKHPRDSRGRFSDKAGTTGIPHERAGEYEASYGKASRDASGLTGDQLRARHAEASAHAHAGTSVNSSDWHHHQAVADATRHEIERRAEAGGADPVGKSPTFGLPIDASGNAMSYHVGSAPDYEPREMPGHFKGSKEDWDRLEGEAASRTAIAQHVDPRLQFDRGPEKPGEHLERKSKFDTPELMRARRAFVNMMSQISGDGFDAKDMETWNTTERISTPEREQLRASIAENLYNNGAGAAKKERKAVFVIGPPGTGKSALVGSKGLNLMDPKGFGGLEVDSDLAKSQLPEFSGGIAASLVHNESDMIGKMVLARALEAGDNLVLPATGKTAKNLIKDVSEMRAKGYQVEVHNLIAENDTVEESVVARFHRNQRLVDPKFASGVDHKPGRSLAMLVDVMPDIKTASYFASDVARGSMAQLSPRALAKWNARHQTE